MSSLPKSRHGSVVTRTVAAMLGARLCHPSRNILCGSKSHGIRDTRAPPRVRSPRTLTSVTSVNDNLSVEAMCRGTGASQQASRSRDVPRWRDCLPRFSLGVQPQFYLLETLLRNCHRETQKVPHGWNDGWPTARVCEQQRFTKLF